MALHSDELKYEGYTWTQTEEKVSFEFILPAHLSEEHVSVSIDSRTLCAGMLSSPDIIKGKLYATVNKEASSWCINHYKLGKLVQISLVKDVKGSQWPVAITGGLRLGEDADAKSTFLLGQLTEGVLPSKTMELYRKSAKAGHLPAQLKLGHIYDIGQANMVDGPNKKEALNWYMMAAAQGCLAAVFYSANFYYKGENMDHSKALPLYLEAISLSQACPLPPPDVVECFDVSGVPQFITSVSVSDRNRLMIFVTACYLAGKLLYNGSDEIEAQPQKSRELWERAASYNHAASLYCLGFLFMEGRGAVTDLLVASRHFHLAHKIDSSFSIPDGIPPYIEPSQDSAYASVSTTPTLVSQFPTSNECDHQNDSISSENECPFTSNHTHELPKEVCAFNKSILSPSDFFENSTLEAAIEATRMLSTKDSSHIAPDNLSQLKQSKCSKTDAKSLSALNLEPSLSQISPREVPFNSHPKTPNPSNFYSWLPTALVVVSGVALIGTYTFFRQRG